MGNTSLRILIVDDNSDFCFIVARIISLNGHLARSAITGADAIREAREFKPHLILMDHLLSDMTGYEVALEIKKNPCLFSVKIVNFTGCPLQSQPIDVFPPLFDCHVTKSSDLSKLLFLIEQYAAAI